MYIVGDFNSRLKEPRNNKERKHLGQYTFEPETADNNIQEPKVVESRAMFIEMCTEHELKVLHTLYRKPKTKVITFKEIGTTMEDVRTRGKFEQPDYILTPTRWRNSVTNVEADHYANIQTDHYPVVADIRLELEAINKKRTAPRCSFLEATKQQTMEMNTQMKNILENDNTDETLTPNNTKRKLDKLKLCTQHLIEAPKKERKIMLSDNTQCILEQRQEAIDNRTSQDFERPAEEFRKSKDNDRRENILNTIERDLDVREQWLGIRQLENKFTPHPYSRNDHITGEHIHTRSRPQKAADYLKTKQWGYGDETEEKKQN